MSDVTDLIERLDDLAAQRKHEQSLSRQPHPQALAVSIAGEHRVNRAIADLLPDIRAALATIKQTDAEPMWVLLPPASVGGKYLEGWCEGQAYLIENYGKEGEGDKAIALTTEYLDGIKQTDAVEAVFETPDGFVMGQTAAKVKRIERQDDGTLTVVIDHWPDAVEAERERCARIAERFSRTMHSPDHTDTGKNIAAAIRGVK